MTTYTADDIRTKVSTDPRWTERALVALYKQQTPSEQASMTTRELNHVGFNGVDAELLTSFAQQVLRGRTLSAKQLAIAQRKLPKYARQLLAIADAR